MKQKIHIFGASGSGTSSIAQAAAVKLGYQHFDSDNYYWFLTTEPFTKNDYLIRVYSKPYQGAKVEHLER